MGDVKRTAIDFLNKMNWQIDQAGLVTFSSEAILDSPLDNDQQTLVDKINAIRAGGGTDIAEALNLAIDELQRVQSISQATPIIILLTDGLAKGEEEAALQAGERARSSGIKVVAIGLGAVNEALLVNLAYQPEDYYYAPTSERLGEIYGSIAQDLNCAGWTP